MPSGSLHPPAAGERANEPARQSRPEATAIRPYAAVKCWILYHVPILGSWPGQQGVGNGRLERKLALSLEPHPQGFAARYRHHVVKTAVDVTGVEQRQDVRMAQLRGDPDLPEEPFRPENRHEIRPDHFDRNFAFVEEVASEVDGRQRALPELPLQAVATAELRGKSVCKRNQQRRTRPGRLPKRYGPG